MRDIKFRGKHKSPYGDRWVRGYYALEDEEHVIIMPHSTSYEIALKEGSAIRTSSVKHTIDVNTLGQYTGLKDKNGTEIYEGDIVTNGDESIRYVVEWVDTGLKARQTGNKSYIGLNAWKGTLEVIGNIYDNQKMIGGK